MRKQLLLAALQSTEDEGEGEVTVSLAVAEDNWQLKNIYIFDWPMLNLISSSNHSPRMFNSTPTPKSFSSALLRGGYGK